MDSGQGPGPSQNNHNRGRNSKYRPNPRNPRNQKPRNQNSDTRQPPNVQRPHNASRTTFARQPGENRNRSRPAFIGYQFLYKVSQCDSKDIITEFNKNKIAIMDVLQNPIEKLDFFPLILEIANKVSDCNFPQLKLEFILGICNSNFIKLHLVLYLANLPFCATKRDNMLYWNDQVKFWNNLIVLLETITAISPSTAMSRCRVLIESSSKACIDLLKERHGFELPEEYMLRLQRVKDLITQHEKVKETEVLENPYRIPNCEGEPPTSFRQLSLLPTEEDLLETQPFLRPNIVMGAYSDVDHYLDVQFRLLREDCFGPIREGIQQFRKDPNRRHYDNIRIFRNVHFAEPYVSDVNFGNIIEVDRHTKRIFKNIKWEYNKRFLFGALILLSKDNCKSFIVGTVADREPKYFSRGKIPVSLITERKRLDINKDDNFLMIESDVYFEPYYHVLKVLQDQSFPEHLPMKKYIVDVEASSKPPQFFESKNIDNILPTAEETGLNNSQYEAFKLAITHEFAVIQGPPGTGKTYMGVKVAEYLLQNLDHIGCLLLIVCYTNHALDQFLEAILNITDSLVRIGGQSRLEIMKPHNLNNVRRDNIYSRYTSLYYEKKDKLKITILHLKQLQNNILSLDSGITTIYTLSLVEESKAVCDQIRKRYSQGTRTTYCLMDWLIENIIIDYNMPMPDIQFLQNEVNAFDSNTGDDRRTAHNDDLDEFVIEDACVSNICVFSLKHEYEHVIQMITRNDDYRKICQVLTVIEVFKAMKSRWDEDENADTEVPCGNPTKMPTYNRWKLYFQWVADLKIKLVENVSTLQDNALAAKEEYDEARMILDIDTIKDKKVVGMTTTGAARLQKMIKELAPPIVIIEEAAEVLEQHIITTLHKNCQHVILIGDQQQLRPSAAHMELARHYNIEVSLFERMINNKIHSRRLAVQHRMRPEFSALISPHIYPDLQNHPSVENFPNIRGMKKNLFFYTHDHLEETGKDSTSKFNSKEADVALRLANYLMMQGYEPQDITLLCCYTAQMFYMKREKKNYVHLNDVKVTVVDNYQGEESKIIILSLVRNNLDNKIGFLATPNRVCVALSRAKEGFYIFGNINMLKSQSELWMKISGTLEQEDSVGPSLQLQCFFHPENITNITTDSDFDQVPEGGCMLKCDINLSCGHGCPLVCHGYDRNHETIKCIEKCERFCENQHVCPLPCAIECAPCKVFVNKNLPCTHNMDIWCSTEPKDAKCLTTISVILSDCGHEAQKACYVDLAFVKCSVPCKARMNCGHVCEKWCHVKSDPDHEQTKCEKPCANKKKGCTLTSEIESESVAHQCQNMCYEECDECKVEVTKRRTTCRHSEKVPCNVDINTIQCKKKCARKLKCNHFCKKLCNEQCGDCDQEVDKVIPGCNHVVRVQCSIVPTEDHCTQKCKRLLECGHECLKQCNQPCDVRECEEFSNQSTTGLCGHKIIIPCKMAKNDPNDPKFKKKLLRYCKFPCSAVLSCDHRCEGSCSECYQFRLHAPCAAKCNKDIICGHRCIEPCNEVCPPCNKPCEVSCPHSKCKNQCGRPCVSCKEKCARRCPHGQCNKLCGQPCSIAACSEPCPKKQKCEHPCRGLCGHPCPNVCKICKPDDFPKDFLGDDYEDDAKLVLLEDCHHIIEVEEMDTWMSSKMNAIGIKSCPKCRKPILKSYRYKDIINNIFKFDINPVKEKVYGSKQDIIVKMEELNHKLQHINVEYKKNKLISPNIYKSVYHEQAYIELQKYVKRNKRLSLMQIEMSLMYSNILEILLEKIKMYKSVEKHFIAEFTSQINDIYRYLIRNVKKINYQQQQDINCEINRLHATIQYEQLVKNVYTLKNQPDILKAIEDTEKIIFSIETYNKDKGIAALKSLKDVIKSNVVIMFEQERKMIVKAIGLKAGHWFKCPNGHFYCIGDCGGAMVVGKCPDCGAAVGGTSHTLLPSNSHAKEMDGSKYPAWSEQNNLDNFHLD
ncbi:NFX1-type zinc finger-containing protein 1 [Pieris rapae]|uniref:NFX1-type zinc finger-containing protein 1 n=1 Tax=Pieris rapae TaxID=64459 RepID=UPI001E27F028|nr:NFX1-type zinc finger-containing protein 1 [Pieris rapae]XP_022127669.2 NFX1-type zinc finger-containing protein 1 [Pieris rapae]